MQTAPSPAAAGTVIVGMSGGVDSAVSALLLKRAGYAIQGLFMSNWDDSDSYCTAAQDFQDARTVCGLLDIPLHRVSFATEYRERVFAHFLREYSAGRTPNPDVLCNREIKFGVCMDYMQRLGGRWIATGHYARLRRRPNGVQLLRAADASKDQSYFLHGVAPRALAKTLFPIGDLPKDQVRALAHAAGLPVFDKPDSTGICFVGERPFEAFLGQYLRQDPGPIENSAGDVVGEHRGLSRYTLGQRSGLHIGGRAGASAAPWYVAAKDASRNTLIVVQDQDHPLLLSASFDVDDVHWIDGEPPNLGGCCTVKTRYRQADLACAIERRPAAAAGAFTVLLRQPARAVTPGQYAVFYRGDECLGGGVIGGLHQSRATESALGARHVAPAAH